MNSFGGIRLRDLVARDGVDDAARAGTEAGAAFGRSFSAAALKDVAFVEKAIKSLAKAGVGPDLVGSRFQSQVAVMQRQAAQLARPASRTATADPAVGAWASFERTASRFLSGGTAASSFQRFVADAQRSGGAAAQALRPVEAAFGAVGKAASAAGAGVVKFSAALFAIEAGARLLKGAIVDPMVDAVRAILNATEASKAFEASISGVVGGLGKAREVNRALVVAARDTTLSIEDMRDSARALAASPALSARLALGTVKDAREEVERYARTINRLAILDPVAGTKGAGIATRELVEGDAISLKRRFGLGVRQVASGLVDEFDGNMDRAIAAVKNDPSAALRGLDKLLDVFLPESAVNQSKKLLSVRVQKLKDTAEDALARVGDSGFYAGVTDRLQSLTGGLLNHFDSPEFKGQAQRVSDSLTRILDNVGKTVVAFLSKLTGTGGGGDTVGAVVELTAKALEKLARLSDGLPSIANATGTFFNTLGGVVDKAVGKVDELISAIKSFSLAQNLISPEAFDFLKDGGLGLSERRARAALATAGQFGIGGGQLRKVELDGQRPEPGSPGELFDWRNVEFFRQAAWARLSGQAGSMNEAFDRGRDYVRQAGYDVDASGVPDVQQRAMLAKITAVVQNLSADQLKPDRAGVEVLAALRSSGLLSKLEAVRAAGVPAAVAPAAVEALPRKVGPDAEDLLPPSVKALIADEGFGPSYGPLRNVVQMMAGKIPGRPVDPLASLVSDGAGLLNAKVGGGADPLALRDLFTRVDELKAEALKRIDAALKDGGALVGTAADTKQLRDSLDHLRGLGTRITRDAELTADAIDDELKGAARNYGVALEGQLGQLPPAVRVLLLDKIAAGTTSLGRQVADALDAAGRGVRDKAKAWGRDSLPLSDQQKLTTDRAAAAIEQAGAGFGGLRPEMDAKALRTLYSVRPTERASDEMQLGAVKAALPDQERMVGKALDAYKADPGSELALADVGRAQEQYVKLLRTSDDLTRKLDDVGNAFRAFGQSARESIEHGIGDALFGIVTQTGSVKDAFKSLADSLLRTWIDLMVKLAAEALIQSAFGKSAGGGTGGTGGTSGGGWLGALATGVAMAFAADGGTFGGGLTFLASGGVVDRPRLAVVGERRDRVPELVAPLLGPGRTVPLGMDGDGLHVRLPGGRKVGASLAGGMDSLADGGFLGRSSVTYAGGSSPGGGSLGGIMPLAGSSGAVDVVKAQEEAGDLGIYVVANTDEAVRRGMHRNRSILIDTVVGDVKAGRRIAKTIKRMSM